jgi:predicted RNase H-like HicB family nuclease
MWRGPEERTMDYIAYLHKDAKSDFGVSITAGKSLEEARRKAPEALTFHIVGMLEDGQKIPKPSSLDDLAGDPARKGAVAFLVVAELPRNKTVRVNITSRQNQIELIDRLVRQAGLTRSAYIVQSATSGAAHKTRNASPSRRSKTRV